MNQPSARSTGRGAPRGRRPRRSGPSSESTEPTRTGNLTTTNLLPAVEAPTGFAALGVPARIDDGLAACGFAQPFAIQTEAVPVAMQGRDVCGRAKTGSGKTLAFGVPMLARITDTAQPRKPLGLVLVPTRELAVQVAEVLQPIAAHAGMTVAGRLRRRQPPHPDRRPAEGRRARGGHAAAPDRPDQVERGRLSAVQIVCLDEADRMADDGFTPQVEWILRHCTGRSQTMLFSATLDGDVGHLIRHYLKDPIEVAVDAATDTVGTMHHLFLAVHHMDKSRVVAAIGQGIPKVVVFCQTKRLCDKVDQELHDLGVKVAAIHGDLPQKARERALQDFSEGRCTC
jgi:superfamily II DNA/RNA helicase